MKRAVLHDARQSLERCQECGLLALAALRGETEAATARQVWRHDVCGHVIGYRPALREFPIEPTLRDKTERAART